MITLIVSIHVVPESIAAWRAATLENARASRQEPGMLAFDLLSDRDAPAHFALVEKYRDEAALAAHKATPHYKRWVEVTEPLQAEPRTRAFYTMVEG